MSLDPNSHMRPVPPHDDSLTLLSELDRELAALLAAALVADYRQYPEKPNRSSSDQSEQPMKVLDIFHPNRYRKARPVRAKPVRRPG